jgi:double-strand break repair protein MRE11
LDLVVWGHEHECIPKILTNEESGVFFLYPGSTTPTSLIEAESKQKHCFMLSITKKEFECLPIPLLTARPIIYRNVELKSCGIQD